MTERSEAKAAKDANKIAKEAKLSEEEAGLAFLRDVTLTVSVELGRTELSVERLLRLEKGSVIEVDKLNEEPLDIYMNGRLTGRGEAVIVNEKFGVRVTQVTLPFGEDII